MKPTAVAPPGTLRIRIRPLETKPADVEQAWVYATHWTLSTAAQGEQLADISYIYRRGEDRFNREVHGHRRGEDCNGRCYWVDAVPADTEYAEDEIQL